jgi:hypothetical protein
MNAQRDDQTDPQLEELLRSLPLRAPSPRLDRRLGLGRSVLRRRWLALPLAAAVAAAVCVALIRWAAPKPAEQADGGGRPSVHASAPGPQLRGPVRFARVFQADSEETPLMSAAGPFRRTRTLTFQEVIWLDPQRSRALRWIAPCDETIVLRSAAY